MHIDQNYYTIQEHSLLSCSRRMPVMWRTWPPFDSRARCCSGVHGQAAADPCQSSTALICSNSGVGLLFAGLSSCHLIAVRPIVSVIKVNSAQKDFEQKHESAATWLFSSFLVLVKHELTMLVLLLWDDASIYVRD